MDNSHNHRNKITVVWKESRGSDEEFDRDSLNDPILGKLKLEIDKMIKSAIIELCERFGITLVQGKLVRDLEC